ncbi:MAG: hypothetical protein DRI57_28495 [Deltaproteobacteria bacterium]|nr:MAG: hypothetical protein DRI57_28495 [Deltaproteobacteria bacterium]
MWKVGYCFSYASFRLSVRYSDKIFRDQDAKRCSSGRSEMEYLGQDANTIYSKVWYLNVALNLVSDLQSAVRSLIIYITSVIYHIFPFCIFN